MSIEREFRDLVTRYLTYTSAQCKTSEIRQNLLSALEDHIEALIYNVVSLACTMALVYESKRVEPKHVRAIDERYRALCGAHAPARLPAHGQRGGMSMPEAFFNPQAPSTMSPSNFGGLNSTTVNFAANEARVEIATTMDGVMMGGAHMSSFRENASKPLAKFVRAVAKLHSMTVSKQAIHDILLVMFHHLDCLAADMRAKPSINVRSLEKIFKLKRHAVFN